MLPQRVVDLAFDLDGLESLARMSFSNCSKRRSSKLRAAIGVVRDAVDAERVNGSLVDRPSDVTCA
jgi:hypothetical protein